MAFVFPTDPEIGDIHGNYQWDGEKWVLIPGALSGMLPIAGGTMEGDLTLFGDPTDPLHAATKQYVDMSARRNRIVNGAMQISQENGSTLSGVTGYYLADQWLVSFASSAGTFQHIRADGYQSPNGSRQRLIVQSVTPDASIAATEHWVLAHSIEGNRVADFEWGTAQARQVILRFGVRAGVAGTFGGSIRNGANNRSYVFSYTIAAGDIGVDVEQIIVIPGDVTGTWPIDTAKGIDLNFSFMSGTTYTAAVGWNAGNFLGPTGITNGTATATTFHLFDVGLYLDIDNSGTPPAWEMPDPAQELALCQRYYRQFFGGAAGFANGTTVADVAISHTPPMRIAPTVTGTAVLQTVYGYTGTHNPSSVSVTVISNYPTSITVRFNNYTGLGAGQGLVVGAQSTPTLTFNARM